eukprot:TRINITY_DN1809_c0_g1_i2.p1 TRINITY_DN1809_c0_g1~~TRINITY_DN1809_c0_g1_i2.p1  ORF type:complete len:179 (-),score=34.13 TRINITY_DN1809_c0_g1_i2:83-619(-)
MADCANLAALSLYTKQGIVIRDTMIVMKGSPSFPVPSSSSLYSIRPMVLDDVETCDELFFHINGFHRRNEMKILLKNETLKPHVVEKDGEIVAYSTGFTLDGHTCAMQQDQLYLLLNNYAKINLDNIFVIWVPVRLYPSLMEDGLKSGLTINKTSVLMAKGEYHPPRGDCFYLPSSCY